MSKKPPTIGVLPVRTGEFAVVGDLRPGADGKRSQATLVEGPDRPGDLHAAVADALAGVGWRPMPTVARKATLERHGRRMTLVQAYVEELPFAGDRLTWWNVDRLPTAVSAVADPYLLIALTMLLDSMGPERRPWTE